MELKKNDRREIFGWLMYDWANSAFYTTVVSVLLGPYLTSLAQAHVGENGVIFDFGFLGAVTAKNLFSLSITVSVFCQVLFLPILGGIADYSNLKKRLMMIFCYSGVTASSLLFFIADNYYVYASVLLIIANLCFGAANVFYNAYLVDLTTEDKRDFISSYGFASGYLGGIIMLLLNIFFVQNAESFGLSTGFAVRLSLLAASLWWGLFAFFTFYLIKSRGAAKNLPEGKNLYTPKFFTERPRWKSATTCAVEAADLPFRKLPDLLGHKALFHDFTNKSLAEMNFDVPLFSPADAGEILAELTALHRFTLYEYFITDKIGHAQSFEKAEVYLPSLAAFVRETLQRIDLEMTTVILTSDHGNIEDLSVRTHTLNDVPTIIWGRNRLEIAEQIKDLSDITPIVLNLLTD